MIHQRRSKLIRLLHVCAWIFEEKYQKRKGKLFNYCRRLIYLIEGNHLSKDHTHLLRNPFFIIKKFYFNFFYFIFIFLKKY